MTVEAFAFVLGIYEKEKQNLYSHLFIQVLLLHPYVNNYHIT